MGARRGKPRFVPRARRLWVGTRAVASTHERSASLDATAAISAQPSVGSFSIRIREKPPLRNTYSVLTPTGKRYRWADDEPKAENVLADGRWSSTAPGGDESFDGKLPRSPSRDYADLEPGTRIQVRGASGEVEWDGRLERSPRASGDELAISPSAVGYQAALDDNKTARMIYRDIDLSRWQGPSVERRLAYGTTISSEEPSAEPDPSSGEPSLKTGISGAWGQAHRCEAFYNSQGLPLGSLYYAWKRGPNTDTNVNWTWQTFLSDSDSDLATAVDTSGNLRATGPGSGTVTATTSSRIWAAVLLAYAVAAGTDSRNYDLFWTALAVYGDHGLTLRGTEPDAGFYASDIIGHAISTWTDLDTEITPTGFIISHAAFPEPTTVSEIVTQANRFDLYDWFCWGKTFHYQPRGQGKTWRTRVAPSELSETGPQWDRVWNSIFVAYQDVDGTTKTVGPEGSGADTEDSRLTDPDPENPANKLGLTRRDVLTMQTATPEGAIKIGQQFLDQAKQLDTSGQAQLVGYVEDDKGVLFPASRVRAGDSIEFIDSNQPSARRISKADHSRPSRTTSVDLDSPPEGLQAVLERLGVGLVRLGLN